ncbi:DUF302 domain-containing protein [Paraburkholderia caballeronis]|uniref:Uncharacterized conserved protein, DUF302 family n=1 Tax=Paraburkholderia caballeronis TaxID=416943 RepID=A0A1H7P3U3_9BURK|nr:DUF302 domain-containing protein [Paraburkholderia caballeronis]PXW25413.1 uncharacterized protein (DUF302 family) [Paraburkholderia caballeronis]PXX01020.1 uncharacterized protein (DUF302 family) [Paraburkholderia caballeronis]RAJ99627.1 uncharacterized protein (DUF302 family) [Paraburkholderia caballeronis]TDV11394.1 uncharacterized protein (DUF302 family) [Paraburkholderia caballeronis]TDV14584.1 uncharacterized protein (DUF302 family) [Paraburkholderia caballeronis]
MSMQPDPSAAVVTFVSQHDFDATIERLKAALAAAGATVFADIDQRDAALRAGLDLRRTRLILFGNPKAGTPVMAQWPHAALELPLRVVVWERDDGRTAVDYRDVTRTLGAYGVAAERVAPLQAVPALLAKAVA